MLKVTCSYVAIATIIAFPAAANAQDASATAAADQQAAASGGIQEIIVTAQRRAEPLSKVPIAVATVSPTQLDTAGVASSLDLARVLPGLAVAPTNSNAFFMPFIRGIGSTSPATGNDSSVATYIDGVYQSEKTGNILDFNDIERIEVLKGPQGTLFGRNATGGAINVITRKPQSTFQGSGEVSYARFNTWNAKAYLTGPIGENLAFSVAYSHAGGGNYIRNTNPLYAGKEGGVNADNFSGKLLWTPSDRFQLMLSLMFADRKTNDMATTYPYPGTVPIGSQAPFNGLVPTKIYENTGTPGLVAARSYRATLDMRYSFDSFDIVSITGFVKVRTLTNLDNDGTSADLFFFRERQGTSDFSQEFQLVSTGDGPLSWTTGVYYSDGQPKIYPLEVLQGLPGDVTVADAVTIPGGSYTLITAKGPTRVLAAYAQATYALTDTTKITAGFRYTSERRRYRFDVSGAGQIAPGFYSPDLIPLLSQPTLEKTFKKPTWRLAIDQELAPDVMAYVSWNRGSKSGLYNLNDFTPNLEPVKPEKIDAYEVGIKSKLFDRKLQVNASFFYYDFANVQLDKFIGSSTSQTQLQNAAKQRIYGLDVETVFQPTRNLQLRASGSLLSAKYRKFEDVSAFEPGPNNSIVQVIIPDFSGERGLNAPRWSFNLGADYTIDLPNESSVQLSASYFRTARYRSSTGSLDFIDENDSLGASITYSAPGDKFYVRAFGLNLTNQKIIGTNMLQLKQTAIRVRPLTYGLAVGTKF